MNPLAFQCIVGQRFTDNLSSYYREHGLLGHGAIDESCGYGSDIKSYVSGRVYSLYTPEHPASDGYTAIYLLCKTPLEYYEFAYGHVSEIEVKIGDTAEVGQTIGKEGNHGYVFAGGVEITLAMQRAGDRRGSHRHVQKRPVLRVRNRRNLLRNAEGVYRDSEGYAYAVAMPDNGYKGCTDFSKPLWNRDLTFGFYGYDVYLLQKALIDQGFGDWEPTFFFGPKTFSALRTFQSNAGITPTGYFGPKTRATLNALYKSL